MLGQKKLDYSKKWINLIYIIKSRISDKKYGRSGIHMQVGKVPVRSGEVISKSIHGIFVISYRWELGQQVPLGQLDYKEAGLPQHNQARESSQRRLPLSHDLRIP